MAHRRTKAAPDLSESYFLRSQEPLHALVFLAPLLVVYEIGAWRYANTATHQRLAARHWLQEFLSMFGAVGEYLPGLVVVVVLLAMHFSRRRRWRFSAGLYAGMGVESLLLALPLILLSMLSSPRAALALLAVTESPPEPWQAKMILAIGAGIYEELVFRMMLIALIHFIAADLLRFKSSNAAIAAIILSALLFAVSHFHPANPFSAAAFAFYLMAGFYFACIYLLRGFGIVVAAHAIYDILVISIKTWVA